jgi:hypothetical protein
MSEVSGDPVCVQDAAEGDATVDGQGEDDDDDDHNSVEEPDSPRGGADPTFELAMAIIAPPAAVAGVPEASVVSATEVSLQRPLYEKSPPRQRRKAAQVCFDT